MTTLSQRGKANCRMTYNQKVAKLDFKLKPFCLQALNLYTIPYTASHALVPEYAGPSKLCLSLALLWHGAMYCTEDHPKK